MSRTESCFYGETPVVLSTRLVGDLLSHLEARYNQPWCQWLIDNTPWTEYSLYFTFAEGTRRFDSYHIRGGLDSVLRLSDSLWYPPEDYRVNRSLANWIWTAPDETGIAVVAQSYLGHDPSAVRERVGEIRSSLS